MRRPALALTAALLLAACATNGSRTIASGAATAPAEASPSVPFSHTEHVAGAFDATGDRIGARRPGVAAVTAEPMVGMKAIVRNLDLAEAGVLAIRLTVQNEGANTLDLRRADIALTRPGGQRGAPLSGSEVASRVTPKNVRIAAPMGGTGLAALPLLIVSLINAAAAGSEQADLTSNTNALAGSEIGNARLEAGQSLEGFVFFAAPPEQASLEDASLVVPLVDVETATRYELRLPLGGPDPSFEPYRFKTGS